MRPTAEIRRHLLLQRLYERVLQLGKQSSTSLKQGGTHLLHVETREFDVYVEYQHDDRIYEAVYPIPMLDAEVDGWLQQTPFLPGDQRE